MTDDSNTNNNVPDGELPPLVQLRPTPVRSIKRVQFPTLQEIERSISIAPPGCTPMSSYTNIAAISEIEKKIPTAKLLHSSTSLEVEFGDTSSRASTCTISTNTVGSSVSTFVVNSYDECTGQEYPAYQQPRLEHTRRGSSVPAKKTVSIEPEDRTIIASRNTANSTLQNVLPSSRCSQTLPSKSILRKPLLALEDSNCNDLGRKSVETSGSLMSAVPASDGSVEDDADVDGTDAIKNEMWENLGKTYVPISVPASSRISRRDYRTPRSKSTLSSSGTYYSENEIGSSGSKSVSVDALPPIMTESRGGRSVKRQLPNLTSVLAELKDKEVVFDRTTAIQALKARILRGEKVTHEEIMAVRNMTLPPHQRHLGYRLPWSKDLYCVKGLVHIPTPNKPAPKKNTFGSVEDLRIPYDRITMEHYGRRQYVLNLAGFEDDHISLYLEGKNRLIFRAERHDGLEGGKVPITVTETILLPPDLPADNLRIVRKPSGTTIIEESWRF